MAKGQPMPTAESIEAQIGILCQEAAKEPLSYFSEADLQSRLYELLSGEWPDFYNTSYTRGPDSKSCFRTRIVHREYGVGRKQRMDLTVFDKDSIKEISNAKLKKDKTHYIEPRFGIELGTEKAGDSLRHLKSDIGKVSVSTERGYIVHLFRDISVADSGTRRSKATENEVIRKYQKAVESAYSNLDKSQRVSIVALLIRVRKTNKRIRGRCKILLPTHNTEPKRKDWCSIALNEVAAEITNSLKCQREAAQAAE